MRRQRFDLVALVREIFELLEQQAARRGTALELFPPNLPEAGLLVVADRNRIRQVLMNLIDNAIKYGREQGRVVVSLVESGRTVRIAVRDDGAGIAPEHQAAFSSGSTASTKAARASRAARGWAWPSASTSWRRTSPHPGEEHRGRGHHPGVQAEQAETGRAVGERA